MRTLKENTAEFLNEVKSILDSATWEFAYSAHAGRDSQKACNYLDTQKFSISKIKEALTDVYEDLLDNLRTSRGEAWIHDMGENAKYAADMIADRLAFNRINRFKKCWSINESLTFSIGY